MIQVLSDDSAYLRKLFDAMNSPHAETLLHVLGYVQKDGYPSGYADWKDFVVDVMEGMELLDAGQFPDSWFPDGDV